MSLPDERTYGLLRWRNRRRIEELCSGGVGRGTAVTGTITGSLEDIESYWKQRCHGLLIAKLIDDITVLVGL
jgi:hypothetical protein